MKLRIEFLLFQQGQNRHPPTQQWLAILGADRCGRQLAMLVFVGDEGPRNPFEILVASKCRFFSLGPMECRRQDIRHERVERAQIVNLQRELFSCLLGWKGGDNFSDRGSGVFHHRLLVPSCLPRFLAEHCLDGDSLLLRLRHERQFSGPALSCANSVNFSDMLGDNVVLAIAP